MGKAKRWGFATRAIHDGEEPNLRDGGYGDVVSPIHLASTFARRLIDEPTSGLEYSRSGNPTRHALERRIASLEGAEHGLAFSSGRGAETTVLLSLKQGDHVVSNDDLYGGTHRLFRVFENFGIKFSSVDASDPRRFEAALTDSTRLVWLESPTNPMLKLCDIGAISKLARAKEIPTLVDNTFASPVLQQPLALGATLVLHSSTKYLGGHSDVIGGAIATSDESWHQRLKFLQNAAGAVPGPFDCFMVLRGTKTLEVRMQRHCANAMAVANMLEGHPKVERVYYPGLESHPQLELARQQMVDYGGLVSCELRGGLEASRRFLEGLELFALAESLGGVESLAEHPALMTHASLPREQREALGISDGLIRLSVGIEDQEDILSDLEQALSRV